jgi:hypothetical protein
VRIHVGQTRGPTLSRGMSHTIWLRGARLWMRQDNGCERCDAHRQVLVPAVPHRIVELVLIVAHAPPVVRVTAPRPAPLLKVRCDVRMRSNWAGTRGRNRSPRRRRR